MTPPTLHELAGIFMLALATAVFIAHPTANSHAMPTLNDSAVTPAAAPIDGIEDVVAWRSGWSLPNPAPPPAERTP